MCGASAGSGWIAPRDGFAQLERLLRDDATHVAVLPIDWGRFIAQLPADVDRDFFLAVAPTPQASVPDVGSPPPPTAVSVVGRLAGCAPDRPPPRWCSPT